MWTLFESSSGGAAIFGAQCPFLQRRQTQEIAPHLAALE